MAKKYDLPVMNSAVSLYRIDVPTEPGDEPGLTRQEMADECDVNAIMARYEKTGALPGRRDEYGDPMYLDMTQTPSDLLEALNLMNAADDAFMRLPASVRKEFDNDPFRFVEFASDPANVKRMREWGLAEPEKVPDAPMRVEVVNPSPAPGANPRPSPDLAAADQDPV